MVARVSTVAFEGVEARPVDVQVQIAAGTVAFTIVGLGDKAVAESRERVRSALIASGLALPAKRITVNPGAKLSLQKHFHRAEHWVVVNGTAIVTRDDEEILLRENESVFVPLGCMHRLENPGKVPLNLIEVQSGAYLGEDDIVRMQDIYHRA